MKERRKKINYLNNADLLIEIHKSKMSYCWVLDPIYSDYDIIVQDMNDISYNLIELGKEARVKRINNEKLRKIQKKLNCTPKKAQELALDLIEKSSINDEDVVIRVMSNDHIPDVDDKKIKTNFKPFKHYILKNNHLIEVARSHWKGSLEYGEFDMLKGSITNELGRMFIVLAANIATKANYRNYTFNDEMQSEACFWLTKNALAFNEDRITVQLNPFAYYTTLVNNVFKAVLNTEKINRDIRDDLLEANGYDPSTSRMVDIELGMVTKKKHKKIKTSNPLFDFGDNDV